VSATASAAAGQAPFTVTLSAAGDAASYHWDFGDGTSADGASVQHVYATGLWTAIVTATAADGETTQAHVEIRSETVTLAARTPATYGRIVVFTGSLRPAAAASAVTLTAGGGRTLGRGTTGPGGGFRIRARAGVPGPVVARADQAASSPFLLAVRPAVTIGFTGHAALYGKLSAVARIRPASAGTLAVTVRRAGTVVKTASGDVLEVPLDTRSPGSVVVTATTKAAAGWLPANTTATTTIAYPQLTEGAVGSVVVQLGRRLAALGYIAPPASGSFDGELLDSVYAFQKVQGLDRTGMVTPAFWAKLGRPLRPKPRYAEPADHLEVSVARQVLYVVRGGRVTAIVSVSTAGVAGDYTPRGRFAVYRKVLGFDPSPLGTLYDPMYFTGGYAIHGNPSVPPYPASHGCIRVPMWIAPTLYATNDYGETVYVN
jgi:peptidoglycan hydrolase-like protein with peptidoglycan-binding domain